MATSTPIEITCSTCQRTWSTKVRGRGVMCRCGRSVYVRADGTTTTPPAAADDESTSAKPARRVPRVRGYAQAGPAPAGPAPTPPVPAPAPVPSPAPVPIPAPVPAPRSGDTERDHGASPPVPPRPSIRGRLLGRRPAGESRGREMTPYGHLY
ncbi:MAG: hypothetical protein JNL54_03375 [Kineosporiaceae bacterium]|nr:hypothetical protein [Kineosporiaceae bacterium]